jgi:hypothetical protein
VKWRPVSVKPGGAQRAERRCLNGVGLQSWRGRRATVSSKVTGKVVRASSSRKASPSRQGQIVAHLDDTQARASLNLAEAQLGRG